MVSNCYNWVLPFSSIISPINKEKMLKAERNKSDVAIAKATELSKKL